jgi:pimeloyl-ACP methyl ester carboxylesterase
MDGTTPKLCVLCGLMVRAGLPRLLRPPIMLTKVVDTDRGPVEYSEAGTGDPILYFHGTGVTGDAMVPVESQLIDDGFRLIVPNRPGYGKTPLSSHDTAAECGNVAAALLDSLGIAEISVMGSSGGAAFATSFTINHPNRVKSLVLLCPQLHRWDDKRWLPMSSRWTLPFLRRPFLRKLLLKLYRIQLPRMSVEQFLKVEAGDRYFELAGDPASLSLCKSTLLAMANGIKCTGFENDFVIFTNEDMLGGSGSMGTPTLLIHDASDPMAPVEHVDWFASKIPNCERVAVHAAGHLIWVGRDADLMHQTRVRFLKGACQR